MASEYFAEIANKYKDETSSLAKEFSAQYKDIADLFKQISDKEMTAEKKIPLLKQVKAKDEKAVQKIEEFIKLVGK